MAERHSEVTLVGRSLGSGPAVHLAAHRPVERLVLLVPFCLFSLWVSWPSVRSSWAVLEGSPDPAGLPRYPLKTMILVAFALLILQGLAEVIRRAAIIGGVLEPESVGGGERL